MEAHRGRVCANHGKPRNVRQRQSSLVCHKLRCDEDLFGRVLGDEHFSSYSLGWHLGNWLFVMKVPSLIPLCVLVCLMKMLTLDATTHPILFRRATGSVISRASLNSISFQYRGHHVLRALEGRQHDPDNNIPPFMPV